MAAISDELQRLLRKHGVDKKVEEYCTEHKIMTISQFAELADSKADVVEGICMPAGLDTNNRPICGPVKSAWRDAEALVEASLDRVRKGKMNDLDDPIDPD
eukprot:420592-Karenia_brevis.AAC.1